MKKIILLLIIVSSSISFAQKVNGIKIEKIPHKYVLLLIQNKGVYNIKVSLDYGQMEKLKGEKGFIIGEDDERLKFNSVISAINFLEKKGYKLLTNQLYYTPFYSLIFENGNYIPKKKSD